MALVFVSFSFRFDILSSRVTRQGNIASIAPLDKTTPWKNNRAHYRQSRLFIQKKQHPRPFRTPTMHAVMVHSPLLSGRSRTGSPVEGRPAGPKSTVRPDKRLHTPPPAHTLQGNTRSRPNDRCLPKGSP